MRLCLSAWAALAICGFAADDVHREPIQPYKVWKDVPNTELKKFTAPTATRYELANGMVVFLLEDHELPIVDLSMTVRAPIACGVVAYGARRLPE